MENDFSAIKSLHELKTLLDSGAITPEEFAVLKRKIIYGNTVFTDESETPTADPEPTNMHNNPAPVVADPVSPEYTNESYVNFDANVNRRVNHNTDTIGPEGVVDPADYSETKNKDWLVTIIVTLGILLLIGLIAYQLFGEKSSEKLTSKSGPTEEVIGDGRLAVPEESENEPEITTSTPGMEPNTLPGNTTTPAPSANDNAAITTTEETKPAAPTISNEEALDRIKDRLQSFYDDLKAAPFSAQRHFAFNVERFYTLTNTSPAAINENINTNHFPEFQDSEASIEDGSLKLENSNNNGYEVTYIEHGSAFRKSKGQKQETTARVRAKFDQSFKLISFRQEQLLENKFIENNQNQ